MVFIPQHKYLDFKVTQNCKEKYNTHFRVGNTFITFKQLQCDSHLSIHIRLLHTYTHAHSCQSLLLQQQQDFLDIK